MTRICSRSIRLRFMGASPYQKMYRISGVLYGILLLYTL